jgi:hypothetical protein
MKRAVSTAFLAIVVGLVLVSSPASAASHPDPALTPGSASAAVSQANISETVCSSTYRLAEPSSRVRASVFVRYEIAKRKRASYVVDHLIPANLGGSKALDNLWPQRRSDAVSKDSAESAVHDLVCSGLVDLAVAQQAIATDWSTAQSTMEQAATARKQAAAQFVAATQAAEKQRQLDQYLSSLPPPTTTPPPPPAPSNCPNGTYVNTAGNTVCSPYASPSGAPSGATAQCRDGTYSFSQSRSGTCSSHGGVAQWL